MDKLHKTINEGIKLIDFNNNKIQKSQKVEQENLYSYSVGDFVYKDRKYGYNNTYGKKVAVCVSDEPFNELYMVLDHYLMKYKCPLSPTFYDEKGNYINTFYLDINDQKNGYLNTQSIFYNYNQEELQDTVWAHLSGNEYVPTDEELDTIFNNGVVDIPKNIYWTSTPDPYDITKAALLNNHGFNSRNTQKFFDKTSKSNVIVLLKI